MPGEMFDMATCLVLLGMAKSKLAGGWKLFAQ